MQIKASVPATPQKEPSLKPPVVRLDSRTGQKPGKTKGHEMINTVKLIVPGLPRKPASESIRLNEEGQIEGLF